MNTWLPGVGLVVANHEEAMLFATPLAGIQARVDWPRVYRAPRLTQPATA
jgi:hypothetical protein